MPVLEFSPKTYHNAFGGHEPVLRVRPGDTVSTSTADAHGFDAAGREVARTGNPLTGPFFVEGARPGDSISVMLDALGPNRPTCWSHSSLAPNVVDPDRAASLPEAGYVNWVIEPFDGGNALLRDAFRRDPSRVRLADGQGDFPSLSFPVTPMLGCIGVAPPGGQVISSLTSGQHGGNMDWRGTAEGATFFLPVFVEGGMLYLGDGHACQGDGEVVGSGVEVSFDVRFTVGVIEGMRARWPRGEDRTHVFTMGNARPLDQALQHATTEMLRWLEEGCAVGGSAEGRTAGRSIGASEAGLLLGFGAAYEVGNVFDPAFTVVCKLPKELVRGSGTPLP